MPLYTSNNQSSEFTPPKKVVPPSTLEPPQETEPVQNRHQSPNKKKSISYSSLPINNIHRPTPIIDHQGSGDRDFFSHEFIPFKIVQNIGLPFKYLYNFIVNGFLSIYSMIVTLLSTISSCARSTFRKLGGGISEVFEFIKGIPSGTFNFFNQLFNNRTTTDISTYLDMFFWPASRLLVFVLLSFTGIPVIFIYILGVLILLLDVLLPLREVFLLKTHHNRNSQWIASPISILFISIVFIVVVIVLSNQPSLMTELKSQPAQKIQKPIEEIPTISKLEAYENSLIESEREYIESQFQDLYDSVDSIEKSLSGGLSRDALYSTIRKILKEEGSLLKQIPTDQINQMIIQSLARLSGNSVSGTLQDDIRLITQKVLAENNFYENMENELDSVRQQIVSQTVQFHQQTSRGASGEKIMGLSSKQMEQLVHEWLNDELNRLKSAGYIDLAPRLTESVNSLPFSESEKSFILDKVRQKLENRPVLVEKSQ